MQIADRKKKVREIVSKERPSLRIEVDENLKKFNRAVESSGLKKEVYDPTLKSDLSTAERIVPDVGEVAKGFVRGAVAQPLTGLGGSTQMVGDVGTAIAEKISKANQPGTVKDFVALQVEEFAKEKAKKLAMLGQYLGGAGEYVNKVFEPNPRYSQGTMFTNPSVTKASTITAEATPQILLGTTPVVGPALSGGYGLMTETGSTYRDLSAQSPEMSVLEKVKRSVGSGVAVGAMDALGAKLMPRSMMAEPITEALQQIPSNLATGRPIAEGMVDSAVGGYGGASVSHSVANVPQNIDLVRQKAREFVDKLPPTGMAPAFATATPSRRFPATETLGNARQIYIGERAKGWSEIPAEDKFIAPDAKPRAEITDHESKLKFKDAMDAYSKKYAASEVIYNSVRAKEGQWYGSEEHQKISKARDSLRKKIQGSATLKDILDHPELYKQYPFAKDIPVVFKKMSENTAGALVEPESEIMHPEQGMHIAIPLKALDDLTSKNPHIKEFKQTLLHEVNHAIQYYEGHGGGGSTSRHGWSTYLKLLGEVESRDTEFRMDMTPEERKANPPYMSQVNTSLRPGEVDDNRRISGLSDIIPNITTPVEYKPVVVSDDTRQQLDQIRQNFAVYKRYGGKTPKKFYNLALVNTELDLNKSEIRSLMYESFDSKEAAMAALKRLNQMDIEKKTAQYARDNYLDSWGEEKVKPVIVEETTSATDDGVNWKVNKDYKVVATQEDAFNFDDSKVMEELGRRLQGQKKSRKKMIAESVASEQVSQSEETISEKGFNDISAENSKLSFKYKHNKDGTVDVHGDQTEIRMMLDSMGVKELGKRTKQGLKFSSTVSHKVMKAIKGDIVHTTVSRAGQVTTHEKYQSGEKEGQIKGAPSKYNTSEKVGSLRNLLRNMADLGEVGRFWYENSGRTILAVTQGNIKNAEMLARMIAITSSGTDVPTNMGFALRAYFDWKAGKKTVDPTGRFPEMMTRKINDLIEGKAWDGEKTNNFFINIMKVIDPKNYGDIQGVTADMWMARIFGYGKDSLSSQEYRFIENETTRIAKEKGWDPQQAQAAIWTAIKFKAELPSVKKLTDSQSLSAGDMVIVDGQRKFPSIEAEMKHRNRWIRNALAADVQKSDVKTIDYRDALLGATASGMLGQVSWESIPGSTTGFLPEMKDAPIAQRIEFHRAIKDILIKDGKNVIAEKLGLPILSTEELPGMYSGESNPSSQDVSVMPRRSKPTDENKNVLSDTVRDSYNAYAAILGRVLFQDAMAWNRPFYDSSIKNSNGVDVVIGKAPLESDVKSMYTALNSLTKEMFGAEQADKFAIVSTPDGIRLLWSVKDDWSFQGKTNEEIQKLVKKASELASSGDFKLKRFAGDSELISNDWSKDKHGEMYRGIAVRTGRPDIFEWAEANLLPSVEAVHRQFATKYGWSNPFQRQEVGSEVRSEDRRKEVAKSVK